MDKGDTLSAVVGGRKGWREGGGKGLLPATHTVEYLDVIAHPSIKLGSQITGRYSVARQWMGWFVCEVTVIVIEWKEMLSPGGCNLSPWPGIISSVNR